jgi:hypothetical protein
MAYLPRCPDPKLDMVYHPDILVLILLGFPTGLDFECTKTRPNLQMVKI